MIIIALIVAAFVTLYFFYVIQSMRVSSERGQWSQTIDIPQGDTAFGGLFAHPFIDDSLPHYIYKQKEDSIKRIIDARQLDNTTPTGDGVSWGPVGIFSGKKTWEKWWDNNSKNDPLILRMDDTIRQIYQRWINLTEDSDSVKK